MTGAIGDVFGQSPHGFDETGESAERHDTKGISEKQKQQNMQQIAHDDNNADEENNNTKNNKNNNTSRVRVVVRVRPFVGSERGTSNCVHVLPNSSSKITSTSAQDCCNGNTTRPCRSIGVSGGMADASIASQHIFTFDRTWPDDTSQNDLYESSVLPLVHTCLSGRHVTVLAYGQTGCGKTFTMTGPADSLHRNFQENDEKRGVIPRALRDLFRSNTTSPDEVVGWVRVLELHNDRLCDLLTPTTTTNTRSTFNTIKPQRPRSNLTIRDGWGLGPTFVEPVVLGATESPVHSAEEAMDVVKLGMQRRITGQTRMNANSSRSHAIITVTLKNGGKMHFVDLAGSERQIRTGANGTRLKESIYNNLGLLVLGNVISSLSDPNRPPGSVIPYRDSKLTRLLRGSLGGHHSTLMIACVSPSSRERVETLDCLRYASRARRIQNDAVDASDVQVASLLRTPSGLRAMIKGLATEVLRLRSGLGGEKSGDNLSDDTLRSLVNYCNGGSLSVGLSSTNTKPDVALSANSNANLEKYFNGPAFAADDGGSMDPDDALTNAIESNRRSIPSTSSRRLSTPQNNNNHHRGTANRFAAKGSKKSPKKTPSPRKLSEKFKSPTHGLSTQQKAGEIVQRGGDRTGERDSCSSMEDGNNRNSRLQSSRHNDPSSSVSTGMRSQLDNSSSIDERRSDFLDHPEILPQSSPSSSPSQYRHTNNKSPDPSFGTDTTTATTTELSNNIQLLGLSDSKHLSPAKGRKMIHSKLSDRFFGSGIVDRSANSTPVAVDSEDIVSPFQTSADNDQHREEYLAKRQFYDDKLIQIFEAQVSRREDVSRNYAMEIQRREEFGDEDYTVITEMHIDLELALDENERCIEELRRRQNELRAISAKSLQNEDLIIMLKQEAKAAKWQKVWIERTINSERRKHHQALEKLQERLKVEEKEGSVWKEEARRIRSERDCAQLVLRRILVDVGVLRSKKRMLLKLLRNIQVFNRKSRAQNTLNEAVHMVDGLLEEAT